jgi:hypothetical protein
VPPNTILLTRFPNLLKNPKEDEEEMDAQMQKEMNKCEDSSMPPLEDDSTNQEDPQEEETMDLAMVKEEETTPWVASPLAGLRDPTRTSYPFPRPMTLKQWALSQGSTMEIENELTPFSLNISDTSCSTKEFQDSSPPSNK